MWKPLKRGRQLIRERCAPLELQHMFGSQYPYLLCLTLFNIPVPSISGGPPPPHFYLTSTTFSSLCRSSSFFPSLPVSPVPGKVIGEGSAWWKWKWPWRKAEGSAVTLHWIPLCFFLHHFPLCLPVSLHTTAIILLFPSHLRNSRWCNPSLWSCPDQDTLFSTTIAHSYCFLNLY